VTARYAPEQSSENRRVRIAVKEHSTFLEGMTFVIFDSFAAHAKIDSCRFPVLISVLAVLP
jgi:hypothetical protein